MKIETIGYSTNNVVNKDFNRTVKLTCRKDGIEFQVILDICDESVKNTIIKSQFLNSVIKADEEDKVLEALGFKL